MNIFLRFSVGNWVEISETGEKGTVKACFVEATKQGSVIEYQVEFQSGRTADYEEYQLRSPE